MQLRTQFQETAESGASDEIFVRLGGRPTAPVRVTVISSNNKEGVVSPSVLLFDPTNWNVEQTVTVTGVPDGVLDGDVHYQIQFSVTSVDSGYDRLAVPPLAFVNYDDNQVTGVSVIASTPLVTSEAGTTATFTVALNSQPSADVQVAVISGNLAEGTVSPATLTFKASNWNTPQIVTVKGVNDAVVDGDQTYNIRFVVTSADALYNGLSVAPISVTNRDTTTVQALAPPQPVPLTGLWFLVLVLGALGWKAAQSPLASAKRVDARSKAVLRSWW